jgi:hypothetical protein
MILKSDLPEIMTKVLAIKKLNYQKWPIHVLAQAGFVFRKAGELMRAAEEFKYDRAESLEDQKAQHEAMVKLTYETMAVCLRFLERLRPFDIPTTTEDSPANSNHLDIGLFASDKAQFEGALIYKDDGVNPVEKIGYIGEDKIGWGPKEEGPSTELYLVPADNGTLTVQNDPDDIKDLI